MVVAVTRPTRLNISQAAVTHNVQCLWFWVGAHESSGLSGWRKWFGRRSFG